VSSQDAFGPLPESGRGSYRRRRNFLVGFFLLIAVTVVVFRAVLLPFALAIVIAYVLAPTIAAGERLRIAGRNPPRWVVVLVTYLVLLGALSGIVAVAVPTLTAEINKLSREAPGAVRVVRNRWLPSISRWLQNVAAPYLEEAEEGDSGAAQQPASSEKRESTSIRVKSDEKGGYEVILPHRGLLVTPEGDHGFRIRAADDRLQTGEELAANINEIVSRTLENTESSAVGLLRTARKIIQALTSGIFTFFLTLMISAYLLITSDGIFDFFRCLYVPARRKDFDDLVARIDRGLTGVVRGQLIICAINGVLTGIGLYFLDVRYWLFLSMVAAVMSIVPIFGAILSSIPAVMVALSDGMVLALLVLGWIVIIHQIEANLLNPKIMGDAAKVHPVLVIFALLAGAHLAGVIGALLAVPVLSILQSFFYFLREHTLGVPRSTSVPPKAPPAELQPTPDDRSVD
jgi:predicted PurR-regulated permease PerM